MEGKILQHEADIRSFRPTKHEICNTVERKWLSNLEIQEEMENNWGSIYKTIHHHNRYQICKKKNVKKETEYTCESFRREKTFHQQYQYSRSVIQSESIPINQITPFNAQQ
jgi:hypothetical protein